MSVKLTYFNGKGRGEIVRMVLAAAGDKGKYEDNRLEFKDWAQEKPNAPQGTLPYITLDGKTKVGQSIAIARYFAREFNLYGKTNKDGLFIDEIVDIAVELLNKGADASFSDDDAKKKTFMEETAPNKLQLLENAVTSRSLGGNFAVGKALTLADIQIYVSIDVTGVQDMLSKYPKLKANVANTEANKGIKEWLAKRPKTSF